MYKDTITLFNRYDSALGIMWFPTIIHGVDLNIDRAAIVAKFGEESQDNAKLHIKYSVIDGKKTVADKQYLLPKAWENQTNDLLANTLTFNDGQKFDFFFEGEWESTAPIMDSDYDAHLGFYAYMNKEYDHVFAITAVAEYSVIPHFEIMAK